MAENQRNSIYISPETVFGVTDATPTFEKVSNTGDTLSLTRDFSGSNEKRSDRQRSCMQAGVKSVAGDINAEFKEDSHDALWQAWFQSSFVVDGGGSGIDELKAGTTAPSFTVIAEQEDLTTGAFSIFTGVRVNTFGLEVSPKPELPLTFGLIGKDMEQVNTAPAGSTFGVLGENCPITGFVGVLKIDNTTVGYVTELSLSGENGMQSENVVFSDTANKISSSKSMVSGSLSYQWEDNVLIDKYLAGDSIALEFELQGATQKYRFILPNITFTSGSPDRSSSEGTMIVTANFEASYDATEGSQLTLQKEAI